MQVEPQFRWGVLGGAAVLVGAIGYVRFCGGVTLPPKPPPPVITGTQQQLLTRTEHSPTVYLDYLRTDAAAASIAVPTLQDMQRKFAYHADESTHTLAPGEPPIEIAGLRLHLEVSGDSVVMKIDNELPTDVAYRVATSSSLGASCNSARALPFDAMVLHKGSSETRTECIYRSSETSIRITKVETMELTPIASYYLEHVPPSVVGIDERIARGHRPQGEMCSEVVSQSVRSGMENHEIGWRDLVDFYARHRCQTYQFPPSYRAVTADGDRTIPAVDASM